MHDTKKFFDSKNGLMALLIPVDYFAEGINFFTWNDEYQQVAYMNHPSGHEIIPHYHNKIKRVIDYTVETLVMRNGILEVYLYEEQHLLHLFQIHKGDILTLFSGGHGFKVIEQVEMVEIKQGPFLKENDKVRF